MGNNEQSVAYLITHPELEEAPQSVEEQEMALRLERAEKSAFQINVGDFSYFPYTTYEVVGASNVRYIVEIRSLEEKINSCSCPDYYVNTLGTCKHIESVLNFIKKEGKKTGCEALPQESPRAEIFLDPFTQVVAVRWPQAAEAIHDAKAFLSPYLSENQNPLYGVASIEHALSGASPEIASKIRLSQLLLHWTDNLRHASIRENDYKEFMADVKAGKRSLQMLSHSLLPYQEQGMLHLAFQGRAILADEMGLGKTIQAIAACELLRRLNRVNRVVVITPASLKGEWEEQIARFASLPTLIVSGTRAERLACYAKESFFYLVNYEQVRSDYEAIQAILRPDIMILDEAQRIKNWQTKTAFAVKQLKTPYAFVLTGTPIENRIDEIYSIMQVVDPKVLGPLFKFQQDFYKFDTKGKPIGYKNLDELHRRLQEVLLRRRKKDVEEQLPERTLNNFLVRMDTEQQLRYQEFSDQVARLLTTLKKRPLSPDELKKLQRLLSCMRMVADTPYILDEECRECPKLEELENILLELTAEKDTKIIIFSEWERMLFLVRELAEKLNLQFAWHTGSVPQLKRREEISRFKEDVNCRLFLTTDSGSTGLNLQVANVVINLDMPWNPAKLEQRIARAWRKNQTRAVQVINLVTENTIEQRMLSMLSMKQAVADAVLDAIGDLTEMALPSASSQSFIEKMEALTGEIPSGLPAQEKTEEAAPKKTIDDLLSSHSDRIHLLELHQNIGFAVVDKVDSEIQNNLSQIANSPVEVIDFDTYMTLKRLVDAGVLQFGSGAKSLLFQSQLVQQDRRNSQKEKLERATTIFKEAERKKTMVELLKNGGFAAEALPAAFEVFHKGMEALEILNLPSTPICSQLKGQIDNVDSPGSFIDLLFLWMEETSSSMMQYALGI